jgi:DNA (cytosine-5)-methyltransferase 1
MWLLTAIDPRVCEKLDFWALILVKDILMKSERITLGSLFDGSGGFPLGGMLCGITPVWASEVEPFAIRVTTKRLPCIQHLGDINRVNGAKIEPVDIITFGSPCTDLSVAGKRAGLDGKQSVLFYEAIRIIKEMRYATDGKYPRFILWENVPGAFSSNKGGDFKAVLEAIVQIIEPSAEMPAPDKDRWPHADILVGDGWSVAYRTVDAQYFGVAQRRRRVYLVADFGSERAGEVLFEREGVCRDFTPRFAEGQGSAGCAEDRAGGAVGPVLMPFRKGTRPHNKSEGQKWEAAETANTLNTFDVGECRCNELAVKVYGVCSKDSNSMKSSNPYSGIYEAGTSRTLDQSGGNPSCNQGGIAVCVQGSMIGREEKNGPQGNGINDNVSFTLNTCDKHAVAYAMTTGEFTQVCREQCPCLQARDYKDPPVISLPQCIVRRLTPTECARLQGFPDWWCEGLETEAPSEDEIAFFAEVFETHRRITGNSTKPKSRKQIVKWLRNPYLDSAAFHMWGNGICLQCSIFVLKGIVQLLEGEDGSTQHTD